MVNPKPRRYLGDAFFTSNYSLESFIYCSSDWGFVSVLFSGVVQDSLPEILGELLDLLVALEEYQILCQYTEPIVVKLIFSLEESIARILTAFHPYIDALQMVRPAHQKRLFAIIGQ